MAERRSVRVRTTAVAVLVVGLATAIGAAVLLYLFRDALLGQLESAARVRAAEIAATVTSSGRLPGVDTEDVALQLADPGGRVLDASPNADGLPLLARPPADDAAEVSVQGGDFLAVTTEVGPRVLLVALTTEGVGESTAAIVVLLAVGLPVLLMLVGVTTWIVVGRALAPVEAIRREVAAISATELHRRVPDPPGGDEIARLARTMNDMLGRLEQGQSRQRRFVSDASHELRTPVTSIRQHAELALVHPDRSSLAGLAETVLAENLRIQDLVADLLLLAAADERSLVRHARPVDLDDLAFAAAGDLRARTDLQVDTSLVSAGRVGGDAAALRRMLDNVAGNAARHARTRVAFALSEAGGRVVLVVEDDGPGIPEADRERVLERFVRLDAARARDGGGAGLGLAIVAEVAAAHGGTVLVDANPLGGARIEIRLPALAG